ncbi:MAG: helicase-related protein [Alphaproteobacteria bacterium]
MSARARVKAVLGPTNTGKTHLAIERMLGHVSGMIGLPLRLLAREVYDKVVAAKGEAAAALITGEEKIVPETARYFVCTVESMPLDKAVEFVAIDEIQVATDLDRGHVFTDRILNLRGFGETMLLGAETMRPMIRKLLPEAEVSRRERMSTLNYSGHRKITKLPKRSALVAFSAEEVYAIAELLRRHRGGAAVVMGALSPRTRNAQVELYQSGEVDFLVATDAIGMGLNMDVDQVAFASRRKFDGHSWRDLRADEIAQIAGRAGRYTRDGAFGETGECAPFDEDLIERVEAHEFESVVAVQWRNEKLNFDSVERLIATLAQTPEQPGLIRVRGADDEGVLLRLAGDDDLMDRISGQAGVRRLWEACQLPDFRKATPDEHATLVGRIANYILSGKGRIPAEWAEAEVEKLSRPDGDLDALQTRLAHVRTWTYAANRADWLEDAEYWRGRTREVEDRLSDALHAALTQRFIDRRTSALLKGLKREDAMLAGVSEEGEVTVEGHFVGQLDGLDFKPDPRATGGVEGRALRNAAMRALRPEVSRRLAHIAAAADLDFTLLRDGRVRVDGAVVARLTPKQSVLKPRLELVGGADAGALDRAKEDIEHISAASLAALAKAGVRVGRHTIFMPGLLKPRAAQTLAILWHAAHPGEPRSVFVARPGALSVQLDRHRHWGECAAAGYRACGRIAVRFDIIERLADAIAAAPPPPDGALARIIGRPVRELPVILGSLGYRQVQALEGAPPHWVLGQRQRKPPRLRPPPSDNAFAALANLLPASEQPPRRRRRRA